MHVAGDAHGSADVSHWVLLPQVDVMAAALQRAARLSQPRLHAVVLALYHASQLLVEELYVVEVDRQRGRVLQCLCLHNMRGM